LQLINPAYTGSDVNLSATLVNRNQWASIENAPKTTAFIFSSERSKNVGLGLSVVSDKVFVENQTFAYIDFSYKLKLTGNLKVFLGIKAGGNFYSADASNLKSFGISSDPARKTIGNFNPNLGVGAYIKGNKYWLSFSIPRLFNVQRDRDIFTAAKDKTHTYLGAGTELELSKLFVFKPSLMVRKVKGLPVNADLTGFLSMKDRVDFGLSYRTNTSFSLMIFINIINGIDFGYAYETPTENMLSGISLKTHEFVLRFRLGNGKVKIKKNNELDKEDMSVIER
jgi:type IX secretion system PorP/SprF family membrane protein